MTDYYFWRAAFAEVIDPRFYTLEWLDQELIDGRAKIWWNDQAAIVATIREYPTGAKEVHGLIAAGEVKAIRALIPEAERWGRREGAIVASIESRAAWTRALANDGYLPWQVAIRKELGSGPQRRFSETDVYA